MNIKNINVKYFEKFNLQRKIVSHMTTTSWQNIPHVSYVYEPDITDFYNEFIILVENRRNLDYKISFNTLMLKVIVEGILSSPVLNSYLEYNYGKGKGTLYILDEINISIPWLLGDGRMITPIIFGAEKMSLADISNYTLQISRKIENTNIDEMLYKAVFIDTITSLKKFNLSIVKRILSAKLGADKISGLRGKEKGEYYKIPEAERLTEKDIMTGSITVSNIGSLYKEQRGFFALLEIIPPQIFAIGLGSIQEKPGVYLSNKKKEIGIRKILPMTLAFDHRAVDFSSIIPFLKRLDEIFANPNIIHQW
jgi:pyruvate dehydrogenase E2 component (dihydrolipoamide acetyltransferase)